MSNNPEMVTNAFTLRERFAMRAAMYMQYMRNARLYCVTLTVDKNRDYAKTAHNANQEALTAVIACYGDATNMTFAQAQAALDVPASVLEKLQ